MDDDEDEDDDDGEGPPSSLPLAVQHTEDGLGKACNSFVRFRYNRSMRLDSNNC
jgi:hypothetical protein